MDNRITADMPEIEKLLAAVPDEAYQEYAWVRAMCAEANAMTAKLAESEKQLAAMRACSEKYLAWLNVTKPNAIDEDMRNPEMVGQLAIDAAIRAMNEE